MNAIPHFTPVRHKLVSNTLFERYGALVPLQLADSELKLGCKPAQLTECPPLLKSTWRALRRV